MLQEVNDASDCNSRNSFVGCSAGRLRKLGFHRQLHTAWHHAKFDHDAPAGIGTGACTGTFIGTGTCSATEVITR